jgi:hypothetical protein
MKENLKLLISLPRHVLGYLLILTGYALGWFMNKLTDIGAYLMDNEEFNKVAKAAIKAKIKEVDIEGLEDKYRKV